MMALKVTLLCFCLAAFAAANPAAEGEWRWTSRRPLVTPNLMNLPFEKLVDTYKPSVFIPGYKEAPACGRNKFQDSESRIVGGTPTKPHKFPWQVALFFAEGWFCGGSIIDTNWVLTAAHCVDGGGSVDIVAGAQNIRQSEPSQVTYYSSDLFYHEDWQSVYIQNDIALINVKHGIEFTPEIQPICLPSRSSAELGAGVMVTPSGWGRFSDDYAGISLELREVTVPTITNDDCRSYYGSGIIPSIICIDTSGGKGTCNGDSGGPLNYDMNNNGTYFTRGITSFGSSAGCEAGYPDGFTRVSHYLDWIETNTGLILD